MPPEFIGIAAGLGLISFSSLLLWRDKRRTQRLMKEQARRRQIVNQAAVWHGYVPPKREKPLPPIPKIHLAYALGQEDIPKALHAQHRLAGEEKARGRKLKGGRLE